MLQVPISGYKQRTYKRITQVDEQTVRIGDLFRCILRLTVICDGEISASALKLLDGFRDFNLAELSARIEPFKLFPFTSELNSRNSVFGTNKLLIIELKHQFLITVFLDLLTALFRTLPVTNRNTVSQTRFSAIAMISIENERVKN
ncbi:Hypothetical protein CINCED_3A017597, partial [Cinara cedri]